MIDDDDGINGEDLAARDRMRVLRAQRLAAGCCSECGVPSPGRCDRCRERHCVQQRQAYAQRAQAKQDKRIRFAMQKMLVAERMLKEARRELKHALDAAIAPKPDGDGERKQAAA